MFTQTRTNMNTEAADTANLKPTPLMRLQKPAQEYALASPSQFQCVNADLGMTKCTEEQNQRLRTPKIAIKIANSRPKHTFHLPKLHTTNKNKDHIPPQYLILVYQLASTTHKNENAQDDNYKMFF